MKWIPSTTFGKLKRSLMRKGNTQTVGQQTGRERLNTI